MDLPRLVAHEEEESAKATQLAEAAHTGNRDLFQFGIYRYLVEKPMLRSKFEAGTFGAVQQFSQMLDEWVHCVRLSNMM